MKLKYWGISAVLVIATTFSPLPANADESTDGLVPCSTLDATGSGLGFDPQPTDYCDTYRLTASSNIGSSNWSGYHVTASDNKYIGVVGRMTVPARPSDCAGSTYAGWIGLGGFSPSTSLIQTGLVYTPGSSYARFFVQYMSANYTSPMIFPGPTSFQPGSVVEFHLDYIAPDQELRATAQVLGAPTVHTWDRVLNLPDYYDGSQAEWIGERIRVDGQLTNLMPFGDVTWSGAKTTLLNGTFESLAAGNEEAIFMVSANGYFAYPSALLNSMSFIDSFRSCVGNAQN
jgi:hypothetical protein